MPTPTKRKHSHKDWNRGCTVTHHYKLAAAAPTLLSLTSLVGADQVSTPLNVTASLRGNCLVEAQSLDFPEYTPGAGDVHSESTIAVRCSKGTAYSVTLDEGVHGTSAEARRMTNGAESLAYQLYLDAARTTVWGDGVNGSAPLMRSPAV